MPLKEGDYKVGPGKPPLHTRFQKGQSGNRRGGRAKNLPSPLVEALREAVTLSWSTNPPAPMCAQLI